MAKRKPKSAAKPDLMHIAKDLRPLAVPLEKLSLDAANARTHDEANIAAIRGSLRQFGQRVPIVVQKRGMVVRAGNGRVIAAREMGWTHLAALIVDEASADGIAFAIADNRTAELAAWDAESLARLLEVAHVDDADVARMFADLRTANDIVDGPGDAQPPEDPGAQVDKAAELRDKWGVVPGQLWVIPSAWIKCPKCGKLHRREAS